MEVPTVTLRIPDEGTLAVAETAFAPSTACAPFVPPATPTRTTVLPTVDGDGAEVHLRVEARTRYEPVKLLGAGGMGEVILVEDQDIARRVALKRLLPEITQPPVLARFVDEIRTVGRLEHPNIVPIHDVGVDELGRYFFVMRYVEGETLESIIEKLAAGDPEHHRRYSFEARIEIFLGVLHALSYAHERGVVHRDVKPANVMVGRHGEVVLMDWGIAKPLASRRDPAAGAEGELGGSGRGRAFLTRVGTLIGTPAYMSPEQARGENDRIDARSDLFSAGVLFHELIGLRHYLWDAPSVDAALASIAVDEHGTMKLYGATHPGFQHPPAELVRFVIKAMARDPSRRFQSAAEMVAQLQGILEGRIVVQCHITLAKRAARELGRLVDRRPYLVLLAFAVVLAAVVFTLVELLRRVAA